MNLLVIFGAICAFVGIGSSLKKKAETRKNRATNRGSRAVELEEWNRWARILFAEYKELTGLDLVYPAINTANDFARAYYNAFSDPYDLTNKNKWKDAQAIETLRIRHNLPSDDEIYTLHEWMYSKKILHRPTNYTSLAYIIAQCVYRAVHERGYKYGGIDYEQQDKTRQQWQEIKQKYPRLTNDPTV